MYDFPDDLHNVPDQVLWDIMNINVAATTIMTKIAVPMMKKAGKGAIVNVSSGSELQPVPYMTVYASSKAYVRNFTLALQYELAPFGITVQLITPLFVTTKMNQFSTTVMSGGILVPDAESYTRSAVWTLGKTSKTTGYWSHGLQYAAFKLVPEGIRGFVGLLMNRQFREEYYQQQQQVKVQ
jgi:17beta-estradiol 17-dehydrogenase / very-long-chain 3-oxoacyl-CoA reductase